MMSLEDKLNKLVIYGAIHIGKVQPEYEPDQCAVDFPDVFASCAGTRAMSRAKEGGPSEGLSTDGIHFDYHQHSPV
ncbi:hypothetical protein JOB18_012814 [Solea senegalensis]|uniref:Uncharacterized protein n=1 Tax=Solea senegalensis TaxID=28829 RepID=A0AAV6SDU9_SOLSE|nr:hypothetical protein JOB18_012814 [Solea senegalensis]